MISVPSAIVAVVVLAVGPIEPGALIRQGNRLLADQKPAEALQKYHQAQLDLPESPHVYYDQAMAKYALKQFDDARALLLKAQSTRDRNLELMAKHGLGACDHAEAIEKIDSLSDAIALLESAMMQYKAVLDEDPDYQPSRREMHRAAMLWRVLRDKLKKQQQQQQKKKSDQKKKTQSKPSSRPQSQPHRRPQSQPARPKNAAGAPQKTPTPRPTPNHKQASPAQERKKLSRQQAERRLRAMMDRQKRRKRHRPRQRVPVRVAPGSIKDW